MGVAGGPGWDDSEPPGLSASAPASSRQTTMLGYDPQVLLVPKKAHPCRREVGAIDPPRFAVGDSSLSSHLSEEGFAVVGGAVDEQMLQKLRSSLWTFLESATPMRRAEPASWGASFPGPSHLGMLSWGGIGQSEFMWHARTAPGVVRSFEVAWGLEEGAPLLTSFDGCAFFRPPQLNPAWTSQGALSWLHIDQGIHKPTLCGIQGALLLYDQDVSSGGLVVIPRSHKRHSQLLAGLVSGYNCANDFIPVAPDEPALDGLGEASLVRAKAGDLILWDSRTVHASAPASHTAPLPVDEDGLLRPARVAAYVCMVPALEHLRAKPHLAFERSLAAMHWITTSHWPQENRAVSQGCQPARPGLDYLSPIARALVLGEPRSAAAAAAFTAMGVEAGAHTVIAPVNRADEMALETSLPQHHTSCDKMEDAEFRQLSSPVQVFAGPTGCRTSDDTPAHSPHCSRSASIASVEMLDAGGVPGVSDSRGAPRAAAQLSASPMGPEVATGQDPKINFNELSTCALGTVDFEKGSEMAD